MFKSKKKVAIMVLVVLVQMVAWSLISSACIYGVLHDGGEEGKLPDHIKV